VAVVVAQAAMVAPQNKSNMSRLTARRRDMFFYERWEVFKKLVALREVVKKLRDKYQRSGLSVDLNQLLRAISSAIHNFGEGAKHQNKGHKLERYRTTLGEIGECNASMVVLSLDLPNEELIPEGKILCNDIAAMMTNLIKSVEKNWESSPGKSRRKASDDSTQTSDGS
jgi:four helix bundle protein